MKTAAPFRPRHYSGLEGARTITTHQFLLTEVAVKDCIRRRTLGLFTGSAGTGKTFAIESATAELDLPVVRTLFGSQTTKREVARQLLKALTGIGPEGRYYELADQVVEALREPHVVVIDEAQHLNQDCTFFIRHLLDRPDVPVVVLLIGAGGLTAKIQKDPTLESRVYRRVEFAEMTERELLKALPRYHPIYRDVSKELLEELADRCDVVKHRTLAVFTLTAADILGDRGGGVLDRDVLEKSLALISGDLS